MNNSVAERSRAIATYRHVGVHLMETVARWTPSTPEMEAKVMLGRHIWDFAQMADCLGNRTYELRQPKHHSIAPTMGYAALLGEVAELSSTADRVAALYQGILPGLARRMRDYMATTDAILDEPSVVILDRIVRDLDRQGQEARSLQIELGLASGLADTIAVREASIDSIVAGRAAP